MIAIMRVLRPGDKALIGSCESPRGVRVVIGDGDGGRALRKSIVVFHGDAGFKDFAGINLKSVNICFKL
jgi:hypothetical protein